MKTVLCLLGALIATTAIGTPAHAQNYPWCAVYSGRALGGATNWFLRTEYAIPPAARTAPALPRLSILGERFGKRLLPLRTVAAQDSSTTSPSRSVTRRSICAAMSRLCVAMIVARPEARTN
jgi:hypothetical protein